MTASHTIPSPSEKLLDASQRAWYGALLRAGHQHHRAPSHTSQLTVRMRTGESLQQIMTTVPFGLIVLDAHGVIRSLNPSAAQLLNLDPAQSVGRPLTELCPEFHQPLLGTMTEGIEFDVEVNGSSSKRLRACATSMPNGSEASPHLLLSLVENSHVAELEQRLHRAEYQASIGKLARGVAHELNNPLDGVLRYTHLALEQLPEDSPVREHLLHVKEGLERMVRAVRTFLEFSRQVTTPVTRTVSLNGLIEDVLLLVQHRARFQQVQVVKRFDLSLPPVMDGGLHYALANLIRNAFDAMPRGGTLTLATSQAQDHVVVEVADTGGGIPEELQGRLFEPFFSTKPIHHGSGLGLTMAREVVERSGGTITFSSRVGAGTMFRLSLPIARQES